MFGRPNIELKTHRPMRRLLLALTLAVLAACTPPTQPIPGSKLLPTPVGTPVGVPVTKVIGPEGGSLASADGKISLEIPAGALSKAETVGIQEITQQAPGKFGKAFRLSPEGTSFAKPVKIRFAFTAEELRGTAIELIRPAYQTKEGYWAMPKDWVPNPATGTVTVETTHFSDWSPLPGAQLDPWSARVKVGQSVNLRLMVCEEVLPDDPRNPLDIPLAQCDPSIVVARMAKDWAVNGAVGGNAAVGTVSSPQPGQATYTAPAQKPAQNPVGVSVAYTPLEEKTRVILLSHITVEDDAPARWQGTISVIYKGSQDLSKPYTTGSEAFLSQHLFTVTTTESDHPAAPRLLAKVAASYTHRLDESFDKTEQVYCSELRPSETEVKQSKVTIRDGGERTLQAEPLDLSLRPNEYKIALTTPYVDWEGTYESWYFYKGACNSNSDTPPGGNTSRTGRRGSFAAFPLELKGTLDPQHPDQFRGSQKLTRPIEGFNAEVSIAWDLTRTR